ncbi:hypothetical protein MASR1M32_29810 [Rhodobacter sp.]
MTADAGDIVAPSAEGAAAAMQAALADAGMAADEVGYVNAHGTGTLANDRAEAAAVAQVLGRAVAVSSTKGAHGHAIGATGALELLACIAALRYGMIAPTTGCRTVDPTCGLDIVTGPARRVQVGAVLSNSFAFGGLNAVLALRATPDMQTAPAKGAVRFQSIPDQGRRALRPGPLRGFRRSGGRSRRRRGVGCLVGGGNRVQTGGEPLQRGRQRDLLVRRHHGDDGQDSVAALLEHRHLFGGEAQTGHAADSGAEGEGIGARFLLVDLDGHAGPQKGFQRGDEGRAGNGRAFGAFGQVEDRELGDGLAVLILHQHVKLAGVDAALRLDAALFPGFEGGLGVAVAHTGRGADLLAHRQAVRGGAICGRGRGRGAFGRGGLGRGLLRQCRQRKAERKRKRQSGEGGFGPGHA